LQAARKLTGAHILQIPYDSGRRNFRMGNGPARIARALAGLNAISSEAITVEEQPFELRTTMCLVHAASAKVREVQAENRLPILLAGGCINSLASLAGLGPDVALLWFDAHADFNNPESTPSGFIDGMALATITGRCWRTLRASIPGFRSIPEKNVVLIGARDLDPEERTLVEESEITWLRSESIRNNVVKAVLGNVLGQLPNAAYLHIDMDVLDREEGQINEYSSSGGLRLSELLEIVRFVGHNRAIVGAAITAYDPSVDRDSKGLNAVVATVKELLAAACIDNS